MIQEVLHPRPRSGRTLALALWLRALADNGFELSVRGGRTLVSAPVQMTLVDDLEVVEVQAPPVKEAPAVVAHRRKTTFIIACTTIEAAEDLRRAMSTDEGDQ